MEQQIAIGFIRTSHGVKGLLKIDSFSGEREHFQDLKEVTLKHQGKSRVFSVERVENTGKGMLLKLRGIDTPEAGKALSRWEIWVDRSNAAPLKLGEFYQADLCGCSLVMEGKVLGTVRNIMPGGNGDLLEVVLSADNSVKLIPFHREFIGEVDIEKQEIELLKDWVLE